MDYRNRSRERLDDDKDFGKRPARSAHGPRYARPARPKRARPPRRQETGAEHAERRAAEQAEIRRAFIADAGVPPKRAPRVAREDEERARRQALPRAEVVGW